MIDLTVDNLRFLDSNRGSTGTKFINVLQGEDEAEEDYWYSKVRDFPSEGWAYGSEVGTGGLYRVLKRTLRLRDDGVLGGHQHAWLHILGLSQLRWAVVLTAIQQGVEKTVGAPLTVSFDSSTPFLSAGQFQKFASPPRLTQDLGSWTIQYRPFPVGYESANFKKDEPFPSGSPLSGLLTVGDMNPKTSPYAASTFGPLSTHILCNHNAYVTIRAIRDANTLAFELNTAPQAISDAVGVIRDIFDKEEWNSMLDEKRAVFERALDK